jgi:hypothetical protein
VAVLPCCRPERRRIEVLEGASASRPCRDSSAWLREQRAIDVYEVFWTGGASGDWNSTEDGERAVFPLRVEQGCYRVVGDWWRSIFTVTSGPHARLPLNDSRPFWERVALMNWWVQRSDTDMRITYPHFRMNDPLVFSACGEL